MLVSQGQKSLSCDSLAVLFCFLRYDLVLRLKCCDGEGGTLHSFDC